MEDINVKDINLDKCVLFPKSDNALFGDNRNKAYFDGL